MRPLVVTMFTSLDGVVQAPGGPDEDTSGGFRYGGWLVPHVDEALGAQIDAWFEPASAFLLGRGTYEIFAGSWPQVPVEDPVSKALNGLPKHVASRTLRGPLGWAGSTLLGDDVPAAVRQLKADGDGELQVHGSPGLVQTLLAEDLVDELRLVVAPVVLAGGKRLFGAGARPGGWRPATSRTTPAGVVLTTYTRAGEVETGAIGPEYDS
ncbi:dihydrofolate reductase family protein [Trujillonella humicola]|uniref:dihydrofolate reductase family protein n=1 Tax=Trujillonella humicola TaxID=3383699 RepID=UPI003906C57B